MLHSSKKKTNGSPQKNYHEKKFIVLFVVTLMLTSCASYEKTAPVMGISASNGINTYVAADLDYDNAAKVEGEVQSKYFLFFALQRNGHKYFSSSNRYRGLNKPEKQALYRALQNSGKDIILDPQFEVETHRWFFGAYRTAKTKVTGWGVDMKGIKEDTRGNPNNRYSND